MVCFHSRSTLGLSVRQLISGLKKTPNCTAILGIVAGPTPGWPARAPMAASKGILEELFGDGIPGSGNRLGNIYPNQGTIYPCS